MSEARKIRRAAERQALKAARKTGFPTNAPNTTPSAINEPEPDLYSPLDDAFILGSEPGRPLPSLAEISPARLAANRANAQLSTGPTLAGQAISSQNRVTHGLARHNGVFKLLSSEEPNGFEALKQSFSEEHEPATPTEAILVNVMAESHWLSNRAQRLQDACVDPDSGQITDPKLFSLYLRYQTTHTRAFHKCLNDLLKLRAERRKSELGFEAEGRKEEAQRIKTERHEMKKQHHYWDVLLKDSKTCAQISQNTREYAKGMREEPGFKPQYEAELARHGLKQCGASVAAIS